MNNKKFANVAIDIGNITSIGISNEKEVIIESRIKEYDGGIDDLTSHEIFEFDGKKYIINEGKFEFDILKFKKDNYLMLLYYCISYVTSNSDYFNCFRNNMRLINPITTFAGRTMLNSICP